MNVIPGKPETNFETIKTSVAEAVAKHAELVVFPSFCLSGAMAGDLFLQQSFREKCNKFGEKIIALSKNIDIIFGNIDHENRNKVIHASAGKLAEKLKIPAAERLALGMVMPRDVQQDAPLRACEVVLLAAERALLAVLVRLQQLAEILEAVLVAA